MLIVAVATAWGNREGGINSFNHSFMTGLAELGLQHDLACVVASATESERFDAEAKGIVLIEVSSDGNGRLACACAVEITEWLEDRGYKNAPEAIFIGHDTITGSVAVNAARRIGARVALIHHMAYEQYQNLRGGLGEKTISNFDLQQELFETDGAIIFGVGTYLAEKAQSLSGQQSHVLIPGFPSTFKTNTSPNDQLRIAIAGRFTPDQETLKQAELPVEALATAIRESHDNIPLLEDPILFILGIDEERIKDARLETLASNIAGRSVNIVPAPFNENPKTVARIMRQSNLAIVPSYHEGFGLVGWEAIGCEVPLIMGKKTGLFKFIQSQLGTVGIHAVNMRGGRSRSDDVREIAEAITKVALGLQLAKRDAVRLRDGLKSEKGCTWRHTAESFLAAIEADARPNARSQRNTLGFFSRPTPAKFRATNHFERCVELSLSESQGSGVERFDVLADLWFGVEPLQIDDMSVSLSLRQAEVLVTSSTGRIVGARLGDNPRVAGIVPKAGGVWIITDPDGRDVLSHHALGNEALCQIATTSSTPADVTVRVLASPKDIRCDFDMPERDRNPIKEKLMAIVVQKAVLFEPSGQVVLSQAEMSRGVNND